MSKFRYIKFASNFHLFISYFKKSSSTWELERDVCHNGPVSFDPFPDTLYGYQRFFLACGEICRCRSKGDTAFSAAQRFTIKMEFMACLLSRRLSLSVKFGLTLPMVPCASSPVARVSRSSLCETLRKTKRLRKRLGWGCVHTIPESFSCPQMKSYKLRATALTTKIEMTLH